MVKNCQKFDNMNPSKAVYNNKISIFSYFFFCFGSALGPSF